MRTNVTHDKKGEKEDGSDCYAKPIMSEDDWDLSVLSVVVESKQKKVLSREGMKRTVDTSPFYSGWLEAVEKDLQLARTALSTLSKTKTKVGRSAPRWECS